MTASVLGLRAERSWLERCLRSSTDSSGEKGVDNSKTHFILQYKYNISTNNLFLFSF